MHKQLNQQELKALKEQMLLNVLSAEKSIFIHYKNKQLKKGKQNDIRKLRSENKIG
ncbi:MAG: hypothetical protein ACPGKX_04985 [Flavobacteriaceae bacterium]